MKIARFSVAGGAPRLGVVEEGQVADVLHDMPGLSADLRAWLPGGDVSWRFFAGLLPDAPRHALDAVSLHAPLMPSKLMALGANYQLHLDEVAHLGLRPATHQIWFNKQVSAINDPFADVVLPAQSDQVDYEAELAVVIGRRAHRVPPERALSVVGGYMLCNDVSVRDVQMRTPTHTLGKSFDTHGPDRPLAGDGGRAARPAGRHDPHLGERRAAAGGKHRHDDPLGGSADRRTQRHHDPGAGRRPGHRHAGRLRDRHATAALSPPR